ncbi:LYR motif containing 7 [Nesidiocoris tenuis]|uniref:Complex III assembly factor LYRM7 n=1 Tax=Nesidiocoris tenuis TaxID=355587 RepID=A0ABN7AP59_9HEMI|nr:LYR motif containing 7 [Nesidiocoris tenuis]
MAGRSLKKEVLKAFKSLHRTRLHVFEGDERALNAARLKINDEFKKNKSVDDSAKIEEMLGFTKAVEEELRKNVIQAREEKPGTYTLRITPETTKLDSSPYDPNVEIPRAKRRQLAKECCQVKIE